MPSINPSDFADLIEDVSPDVVCALLTMGEAAALEDVLDAVHDLMRFGQEAIRTGDALTALTTIALGLKGLETGIVETLKEQDEHFQAHYALMTTEVPDFVPDNL
jgi:hypothetical protein